MYHATAKSTYIYVSVCVCVCQRSINMVFFVLRILYFTFPLSLLINTLMCNIFESFGIESKYKIHVSVSIIGGFFFSFISTAYRLVFENLLHDFHNVYHTDSKIAQMKLRSRIFFISDLRIFQSFRHDFWVMHLCC